jgi:hypothetical protein
MEAIIMIDAICTRYRCLPSEALARASTVDLYYLYNAVGYYNRKQSKTTNNLDTLPKASATESLDLASLHALSKTSK